MQIVFRVDASIEMGTGHVMRCLTLADALTQQGKKCHFICREHPGHLNDFIAQRGYTVHSLPVIESAQQPNTNNGLVHAHWLGANQGQDSAASKCFIKDLQPGWLVVDHYALDQQWQKAMRPHCEHIMVIDDLADRQHDCDLLLDQTFGRSSQDYQQLVPEHCQLLCGTEYALLRLEFAQWREFSLKRRKQSQLEHLLINLGGVDKDNITTQILKALSPANLPQNCRITVVMGVTAPWIDAVKQQAAQMPWPTEVKVGVNNMAELMANSDLAIGAAGSTSWERCCLGIPTIMVVLADNQRLIAHALKATGAATYLNTDQITQKKLAATIQEYIDTPATMQQASMQAAAITSGDGVVRTLQSMGFGI